MAAEATTQKRIIDALRKEGAWVAKQHQSGRGTKGVPDLLVCHHGKFIALEVKTQTGKPTALQMHQLALIHQAGGAATVVRSPEDALTVVRAFTRSDIRPVPPRPPVIALASAVIA